jgi:hypothetical protein
MRYYSEHMHELLSYLRLYLIYTFGLFSFTEYLARPATNAANSSKSSAREIARPCDCSKKTSGGPASVQDAGK